MSLNSSEVTRVPEGGKGWGRGYKRVLHNGKSFSLASGKTDMAGDYEAATCIPDALQVLQDTANLQDHHMEDRHMLYSLHIIIDNLSNSFLF